MEENSHQLTIEEQQLIAEIREYIKNKKMNDAADRISKLISITNSAIIKTQYSKLLEKIKETKKPKEQGEFSLKVERAKVTFKDVKGMAKLKKTLVREMTLMIKSRDDFIKHKLKPSGILLYGPPGVGKTFFLEAVAGEFEMNVIKADLGSLLSQWVGETEKNIKKLVELAKDNQPCLIILDETDAKLRNRDTTEARGESVVTLNATTQFLETMQEVHNENLKILFTGATNRVWDVDPAAKRPGRLGNLVYVPPPNLKDRFMLFRHYLKTVDVLKVGPFGYLLLALATSRYSPNDIEEICIEAKKQMLYKKLEKGEATKLYTKSEYLQLVDAGKIKPVLKDTLMLRDIMHVIRHDFRNSSLDIWYIEAYKSMVSWEEVQKRTVKGRIFSKTVKEKIKHDGKITKDERKVYKDMFKDIIWTRRLRLYTLIIRRFARWIIV